MDSHRPSDQRIRRWLADAVTAAFVAFTTYGLVTATRDDAVSFTAVRQAAGSPRFWMLGVALSAWVLLGIASLRFLRANTLRDEAQGLWRWGVLWWGGIMWVVMAILFGAKDCGGVSLRVFLCHDFTVDTLLALVTGFPIWSWGGYAFGWMLFGALGTRPK
jgi:hypothetical protein